jgi:queuine tRNA-ribosyltransferase
MTIHNLYYYQQLMREIRESIIGGSFAQYQERFASERVRGA